MDSESIPPPEDTADQNDLLDAEIPDYVIVDTKRICDLVAAEIKRRSISQGLFSQKVLGRSQGTLSDILRNPTPWDQLRSGRYTYRRMYNWTLLQPEQKMAILKDPDTPRNALKRKLIDNLPSTSSSTTPKRARTIFTDAQKKALQEIFEVDPNGMPWMYKTIAERLGVTLDAVKNFFQNAKRRYNRNKDVEQENLPTTDTSERIVKETEHVAKEAIMDDVFSGPTTDTSQETENVVKEEIKEEPMDDLFFISTRDTSRKTERIVKEEIMDDDFFGSTTNTSEHVVKEEIKEEPMDY